MSAVQVGWYLNMSKPSQTPSVRTASNPSIRRRLLGLLIVGIVIASSLASITVFYLAYQEAQEFQDDTLRQIGLLKISHSTPSPQTSNIDSEYSIKIWQLNQENLPKGLDQYMSSGFQNFANAGIQYRLWVSPTDQYPRLAIAQPTSERNELAIHSALRTLFPMLLLIPLVLGLFIWGLNREMASLKNMATTIDQQLTQTIPESLPNQAIPPELSPFVLAINRLLARLHQALMQQKRFTADAAHELRTPLTALYLQTQNLEQATTLDDMKQRLKPLKLGVERSIRLAEQLLDIHRIQNVLLTKTPTLLAPLLRETLGHYFSLADAKGIELDLTLDENITVNTHSTALNLIVGNALDNAIK